jgi:hypothetical protein
MCADYPVLLGLASAEPLLLNVEATADQNRGVLVPKRAPLDRFLIINGHTATSGT